MVIRVPALIQPVGPRVSSQRPTVAGQLVVTMGRYAQPASGGVSV